MELDQRVSQWVEARSGLILSTEQERHLAEFITVRAERLKLSIDAYYSLLESQEDHQDSEFSILIRRITVGETWFYRDAAQFDALYDILRELGRKRRRPISIWSTPCATGEEAFSIAMAAQEVGVEVRILGTDIDAEAIQTARQGLYEAWALRRLPQRLQRFFVPTAAGESTLVSDEVRASVRFEVHNVISDRPRRAPNADGLWDIIFCRNLFIYFARGTIDRVAGELLQSLAVDGWLFTAAAEHLEASQVGAVLRPLQETFAYQRLTEASALSGQPFPAISPLTSSVAAAGRPIASLSSGPLPPQERAIDPHIEPEIEKQLSAARRRLAEGHSEEALESLRQAEMAQPLVPEVHYYLALAHRRLGNPEEFGAELRRTLFLAPDYWPAAFLLAGHHEGHQEWSAAASAYRRVLTVIAQSRTRVFDPLDQEEIVLSKQQVVERCKQQIERLQQHLEEWENERARGRKQRKSSDRRR